MGDPNSDSGTNNQKMTDFIAAFNVPVCPPGATPTPAELLAKSNTLVAFFSLDAVNPGVGIASHGPNFKGQAAIGLLFGRLFKSFPDLTLTEVNPVNRRLYSLDNIGLPTIGAQTTLKGTFKSPWFSKVPGQHDVDSHYSKPLSDLVPNDQAFLVTTIQAFAIFALGAGPLITQLSVYLDRYKFKADLEPSADSAADLVYQVPKHHGHKP